MPAVSFQNVSKTYPTSRGPLHALRSVSFDIQPGEFFGLLGPNGAGKTTLISILAGLARASSGQVRVMGHDEVADYASARMALGIEPQLMSWIQTAYLIAEIIAIPLTGVLTRLFGMRWLFIVSISAFTLASAGCAWSTDFESLIFWRVVQGFSGGSLIPAVFSAVFLLFPVKQQGLATTIAGVFGMARTMAALPR